MKKVIAACCIFVSAVALADGMSFSPLNVGSVQMFAGVSEGRAVEVANQAITDAIQSNYICSVAKCAQLVEQCRNYDLTNMANNAFVLSSCQIGNYTSSTNLTLTLDFSTTADQSGDCALYITCSSDITITVQTKTGSCVTKCISGTDALELSAGENILYFSRIKYANGVSTILVSKQELE